MADTPYQRGALLRFRKSAGLRWRYGKFIRRNQDGTVDVAESRSGNQRTLLPEHIEVPILGPRGGSDWGPIDG